MLCSQLTQLLYVLFYQMMKLLADKDESILLRMQTCLMLSASNSLALARISIESQEVIAYTLYHLKVFFYLYF